MICCEYVLQVDLYYQTVLRLEEYLREKDSAFNAEGHTGASQEKVNCELGLGQLSLGDTLLHDNSPFMSRIKQLSSLVSFIRWTRCVSLMRNASNHCHVRLRSVT